MSEMCPDCGAPFADPAELVAHVRKDHQGGDAAASLAENPYSETPGLTCALCGKTFPTREALAAHDLMPHPASRRWGRPRPMPA